MIIIWFLFALFILIGIHEFGHYIFARFCGVKVLRFSFGFGPIVKSWYDKRGTEFAVSLIPLGGYVKMLDETEGKVSPKEAHLAFNNQSVWKRIAIVAAGPLSNLIFAALCFWIIYMVGIKSVAPIIGEIKNGSIAQTAGFAPRDEIIAINEKPVFSWQDVHYAFLPFLGSGQTLLVKVKSEPTGSLRTLYLPLEDWHFERGRKDLLTSLGIIPFMPEYSLEVGEVVTDSPAHHAAIEKGDSIKAVNGILLKNWLTLVDYVQKHPNTRIALTVIHQGKPKNITLVTGSMEGKKGSIGFLGLRSKPIEWPKQWLRHQRQNPLVALMTAIKQTTALTASTFSLFGRLISGKVEIKALTGPVGIAESAKESAQGGFIQYLSFLALLSVSLGVLNVLPIPLLDGGHLLYYAIEIIRRKPLSLQTQAFGFYLGLFFLVGLMCISLFNDIYRLAD